MLSNDFRIFQYIVCLSVFGFLMPQALAQTNDQPIILVDSIPTDAMVITNGDIRLPPETIKGKSDTEIEQVLADKISSDLIPFSKTQGGANFLCLLPVMGEDMCAFSIPGSDTKLMLSLKNPQFVVVLYRGGHIEKSPVLFSSGKPDPKRPVVSIEAKDATYAAAKDLVGPSGKMVQTGDKIAASTWVYWDLPTIQGWASKSGSSEVFLETSGTGKTTPVIIPGMKEPLQVFEKDAAIKATWYIDPSMDTKEALLKVGIRLMDSKNDSAIKSTDIQK